MLLSHNAFYFNMAASRCTRIFSDHKHLYGQILAQRPAAACRRQLHTLNRMLCMSKSTGCFGKMCISHITRSPRQLPQSYAIGCSVMPTRFNSTGQAVSEAAAKGAEAGGQYIPPPPDVVPPDVYDSMFLNKLGEPTLQSLGLGNWYPSGRLQTLLEFFHVHLDLPWWGSIVLMTTIVRLFMFPLMIISQNNMVEVTKLAPETMKLQQQASRAKLQGDIITRMEIERKQQELNRNSKANPSKVMLIPIFQGVVFVSWFKGMREMTSLPVESMKEGGLWWFTDLTMLDPYYALPAMTALTLLLILEVNILSATSAMPRAAAMKIGMRCFPVLVFLFTMNFPAALSVYWMTQNIISFGQTLLLKNVKVKKMLGMSIPPDPQEVFKGDMPPEENKGILKSLKESWEQQKIAREVYKSRNIDSITYEEAKLGPLKRTFSYDPTKPGAKEAAEERERKSRLQKRRQ
ncbi:mitochondrial inner membrane protein OXA1L [Lingula anatina]|uniref:Mitochondrial inner membrane protein OXA1L n=1 Tax=Lingula anatina TaxID=7574 RepID=A0A1S3JSE7_LINAN|nr:mitochondrial inner membrane protein OXA1L [Lingula anatina]|eukprot:XP_013413310.1 mitochondrial inner membrane protein OXA1L [Lingula anatina]